MAEKQLKVTAAQIEESVEKSHTHSNLSTLNNITSSRVSEWDNKADNEHRHNASEIDGLDNLNVNLSNYYTKTQVDNKVATEIDSINLSSYAKKSEIPTAISDLTNDSNFATQSFVTNKIAEAQLEGGNVDLSGYATKDELNSKLDKASIVNTLNSTDANSPLSAAQGKVLNEKVDSFNELNTAIETLEKLVGIDETVGDSGNLPEGDVNVIASINRLDAKIDGIGNVDLSNYALKEEVTNLINQISSLNANITSLTNANTTLTNKITALETKVAELDLQLNPPIVEEMYYGRLSFQDVGGSVIQYNQITEAMINKGVLDGKLTKTAPKTLGKTSMGEIDVTAEMDYIIMAVPASKNYKVTKDNGIGGKVIFDEETAGANGIDITINNVACKLYGEMLLSPGEMFLYVD